MIPGVAAAPPVGQRGVFAPTATRSSLVWSEYCYLLCVVVALVLVIIPPDLNFPARRVVRQLPLLAGLPLAALCFLGGKLSRVPHSNQSVRVALATLLPLSLLALWIVVGSIHARTVENLQATFLNLGLYMTAAIAAALVVTSSAAPTRIAQAYLRLIVTAAMVMWVTTSA